MKIFYRILDTNPKESSILVRYWTDKLSEQDLSSAPNDTETTPHHCRSDINLNLYNPFLDETALHRYIISMAPWGWLDLLAKSKEDVRYQQVMQVAETIKNKGIAWGYKGVKDEHDITDLLYDLRTNWQPLENETMFLEIINVIDKEHPIDPRIPSPEEIREHQKVFKEFGEAIEHVPGYLRWNPIRDHHGNEGKAFHVKHLAAARDVLRFLELNKNDPRIVALETLHNTKDSTPLIKLKKIIER